MPLEFTKMQGLGNDFVVIDATKKTFHATPDLICRLANRHCGVGCDQVLLLGVAKHPRADFSYRIYNANGSEAFQCGNGARCIGLFVREKKLSHKKIICLEMQHDFITVECQENTVRVDMGVPNFTPEAVPFLSAQRAAPYQLALSNRVITFDVVSMGNPHCVITHGDFSGDFSIESMSAIGRELNAHAAFPDGVNVGFVKHLSRDAIQLHVYERGVGMTQACGSGACAAVAVGRLQNVLHESVQVHQAGGVLTVRWVSSQAVLQLAGPAVIVFDGRIESLLIFNNQIK